MVEPSSSELPRNLDVDAFLVWAEGRPGRYELELGRVLAMSPQTMGHLTSKASTWNALSGAIAQAGVSCRALPNGATVRIDATTAYEPDALVYCGPQLPPEAIEVADPVVVVEIVSPNSMHRDYTHKLIGYFMVPSVQHYLIVNPDRRVLVHYAREKDAIRTRILRSGPLRLEPPGLDLAVEDLFGRSEVDMEQ